MVANLNGASGLRDVSYTNLSLSSLSNADKASLRAQIQMLERCAALVECAVNRAAREGVTAFSPYSGNPGTTAEGTLSIAELTSVIPSMPSDSGAYSNGGSIGWGGRGVGNVSIAFAWNSAHEQLGVPDGVNDKLRAASPLWASSNQGDKSLDEWRQLIADARTWIAREESKLDPGKGSGTDARSVGGVQVHNGKWFVAGQEVTYDDVYFAVRVNQVANIDTNLNDYVGVIQKNNAKVKQANEFLSTLRTYKPTSTSATVSLSDLQKIRNSFSSLYGYDPATRFDLKMTAAAGQTSFDTWIETVKSAVSDLQSDNQTAQLKMERLNNQRSEVLEGLTSFTKGQSQTGASISRNVG